MVVTDLEWPGNVMEIETTVGAEAGKTQTDPVDHTARQCGQSAAIVRLGAFDPDDMPL